MNLDTTIMIRAGGAGSGCNPAVGKCGRHPGAGPEGTGSGVAAGGRLELTMERSGTFKPKLKATPGHVGKCDMPTHNTYRYDAVVTATDKHLSPEGFIMDNAKIQSFFDSGYNGMSEMSCERMASWGARGIGALLMQAHISCTGVTVKIGGSNGAWLTAVWSPPHSVHASAKHFDFKKDEVSKKSFNRIHSYLTKAGYTDNGAGIYTHPDGTKVTVSYKG